MTDSQRKEPALRTCPICGREFLAMSGQQKYCSESCRREAARIRKREDAQRKDAARPKKKMEDRTCPECGQKFTPNASNQIYCCVRCSSEAKARRAKERRLEEVREATPRVCVICGKEFVPKCATQKTCSLECSAERRRKTAIKWDQEHKAKRSRVRTCRSCGAEFPAEGKWVYCPECRGIPSKQKPKTAAPPRRKKKGPGLIDQWSLDKRSGKTTLSYGQWVAQRYLQEQAHE